MLGNAGEDYHHLTCDLIETFQDHSPQDQVVETPTSNIRGFHGGNGLHRQHMSRDCNVTSDDADNPNIKCTRKKVKETCRFISLGG